LPEIAEGKTMTLIIKPGQSSDIIEPKTTVLMISPKPPPAENGFPAKIRHKNNYFLEV